MTHAGTNPSWTRRCTSIIVALVPGCSFFVDAPADSWSPADRAPVCNTTPALAGDIIGTVVGVAGIVGLQQPCEQLGCQWLDLATIPVAVATTTFLISTAVGTTKTRRCRRAKRIWRGFEGELLDDVRRATGVSADVVRHGVLTATGSFMTTGAELHVRAPAGSDVCDDDAWLPTIEGRADQLRGKDISLVRCFVGDVEVWARAVESMAP